ncbi:hypothetical protein JB92DRAFT_3031995 [Gautieria morchelliformis]|nr:hypothetical protein JB92DRAFT_3031995 [Gautieria morchelliformis]
MDQPLFAAVLRKLSKLQKIILYRLDWSLMTVDLHQSIRWVLMLPSITFLTLDIICDESGPVDFFQHPVALDDQGKNDDESRPALERRHLSHLNLGVAHTVFGCRSSAQRRRTSSKPHASHNWQLAQRSRISRAS